MRYIEHLVSESEVLGECTDISGRLDHPMLMSLFRCVATKQNLVFDFFLFSGTLNDVC